MWKKQFLKEENSLLELEKNFLELKYNICPPYHEIGHPNFPSFPP